MRDYTIPEPCNTPGCEGTWFMVEDVQASVRMQCNQCRKFIDRMKFPDDIEMPDEDS